METGQPRCDRRDRGSTAASAVRPPRPQYDRRECSTTAATVVRPPRPQYDRRDRGSTAATAVRPPRPRFDRFRTVMTAVRPWSDRRPTAITFQPQAYPRNDKVMRSNGEPAPMLSRSECAGRFPTRVCALHERNVNRRNGSTNGCRAWPEGPLLRLGRPPQGVQRISEEVASSIYFFRIRHVRRGAGAMVDRVC